MSKPIAVKHYMARDPVTFRPDMDVLEAVKILVDNRISGAPVVDDRGNLIGLLSEKDCMKVTLNACYYGGPGGQVEDYMTRHVQVVDAERTIVEVAERFETFPFRRYPVVQNNRLVGQISRRDVLKALQEIGAEIRPWNGEIQHVDKQS